MHRFTEIAAAVASQADRLNAKRNERERLENQFSSNTCPILSAELEATLAALDIRIELETRTLHELETDALAIRGTIESTAPASHGEKVKTRSLQAAYEQALE